MMRTLGFDIWTIVELSKYSFFLRLDPGAMQEGVYILRRSMNSKLFSRLLAG